MPKSKISVILHEVDYRVDDTGYMKMTPLALVVPVANIQRVEAIHPNDVNQFRSPGHDFISDIAKGRLIQAKADSIKIVESPEEVNKLLNEIEEV